MTINQVLTTLTNSAYYNNGTLTLPSAALDTSGPVYQVINTWLGDNLVVSGIPSTPAINGNSITISGSMKMLNAPNQIIQNIVFSIVDGNGQPITDGNPSLFIDFPLISSWNFGVSFPILQPFAVSNLAFQQAHFLLSSYAQAATNTYPALSKGLNFYSSGLLTSSAPLSIIAGLLGGQTSLVFTGTIGIISGSIDQLSTLMPALSISTPAQQVNLATFLPLSVTLQCTSSTPTGVSSFQANLLLSSFVTIGSAPPIPVSVDISNLGKVLVFQANTGLAVTYGLDALGTFLNNSPVTATLGKYIENLSSTVTLQNVRIYISTNSINQDITKALSAIAVDISTVAPWNILPGYLSVQNLTITFMVNNIVSSPKLTTVITSSVLLDSTALLQMSASFPDPSFDFTIANPPVSLNQIFSKFYPAANGYPTLSCTELDISGTPNEQAYSLTAGMSGQWNINSGIRSIDLKKAVLFLNYDGSETSPLTGSLQAEVKFVPAGKAQTSIPGFMVNWQIPGNFQLQGKFPDLDLTTLASEIAGVADLSLPAGFPVISLTKTVVTFTVMSGQGNNQTGTAYDFSIASTVNINNVDLNLVFEIQKSATQVWGCIAGIWSENWSWSPAETWPTEFGTILKGITFTKTGLLISSLTNPIVNFSNPPSVVPARIQPGLTFFTTIQFGSSALATLQNFFPSASSLNLYAYIANPLSNSQFIGTLGTPSPTKNYCFNGIQFNISPASGSFTLQAGVQFTFNEIAGPNKGNPVSINFTAGGSLNLEGELNVFLALIAQESVSNQARIDQLVQCARNKQLKVNPQAQTPVNNPGWQDPLGIQGLTIENFWGEIEVTAEGGLGFGFGGAIIVETGNSNPVSLELNVEMVLEDGVVPIVQIFRFDLQAVNQGTSVPLTALIQNFTTLNLSWVPVLNGISLADFMLCLVMDPAGWKNPVTQTIYSFGFYSSGNISFYGFTAVFDIQISYSGGLIASGSIDNKLSLANGLLVISDAKGQKGPYGSIDTTILVGPSSSKPYFTLSGSVTILDVSATLYAYIVNSGFFFEVDLQQAIFTESLQCSLVNASAFTGSVEAGFAINADIPNIPVTVGDETFILIPAFTLKTSLDGTLKVTINPSFTFTVTGSFGWGSQTMNVSFNLPDISSWKNIPSQVETYFENNAKQIFGEVEDKVSVWITAIKDGVISIGSDLAQILYSFFNITDPVDAINLLNELNWTASQILNALTAVWGLAEAAAEKLLSTIAQDCSVNQAFGVLNQPSTATMRPDAELLQRVASAPQAQSMLFHFYSQRQEIHKLVEQDRDLKARINRMWKEHAWLDPENPKLTDDLIIFFDMIKKKADPSITPDIQALLKDLRKYRHMTSEDFISAVNQPVNDNSN